MAEEYRIDQCIPRYNETTGQLETFWRVYYWAERPDADQHTPDDQYHWHPDSEYATEEEARKRMAELKKGAKRKSILSIPLKAMPKKKAGRRS